MKLVYDGDILINDIVPSLETETSRMVVTNLKGLVHWEWNFRYKKEYDELCDCISYNRERLIKLITKIKEKDEKLKKIDNEVRSALLYNNIYEVKRNKRRI